MCPAALLPFDRHQINVRASRFQVPASDFIAELSARQLCQRLLGIKGNLERVLIIGKAHEPLITFLQQLGDRVKHIVCVRVNNRSEVRFTNVTFVHADEENLPLAEGSFDLIVSNMTLHWINDIPGVLQQVKRLLRPAGLYLASCFGGSTLKELRQALLHADSRGPLGVTPRICEFMELNTAARLMQQMGFKDPVVDRFLLEARYACVEDLLQDLRNMQETNIMEQRSRGLTSMHVFRRMRQAYLANSGLDGGQIPATFELFSLTGWMQ